MDIKQKRETQRRLYYLVSPKHCLVKEYIFRFGVKKQGNRSTEEIAGTLNTATASARQAILAQTGRNVLL